MVKTTLAELATDLVVIEVDGERAEALEPTPYEASIDASYVTSDDIAREVGISPDSPKYSGLHQHCQYQRTC
jgi:hypothetical protein